MNTEVEKLAYFVVKQKGENLTQDVKESLKIRLLDSLGCAVRALSSPLMTEIRKHTEELGGNPLSCLISGGKTSPDRAAFYNGALVRYLDFNDSYLAKGETCHPSDNIGAILAAADYADATGLNFLTALGIAYQVQCRLSDVAPVRDKGFDHTVQGAYGAAAGVAKALGLNEEQTANAIAISGTCNLALRVTRTGEISNWKGLAYPNTDFIATHAAFLAKAGVTGPLEVFEGDKGFMAFAGKFNIDWEKEGINRVLKTISKKYNAEIHSQSALEGALELQKKHQIKAEDIKKIDIDIFDVAYHIIGGGQEGNKTIVRNKEEADHSLNYIIAVALLDHQVFPEQYLPERINKDDVQNLLRSVHIRPSGDYSRRFPNEMACKVIITLENNQELEIEKKDYEGFHTRPFTWDTALDKFYSLAASLIDERHLDDIVDMVKNIESKKIRDLTHLLSQKEMFHV